MRGISALIVAIIVGVIAGGLLFTAEAVIGFSLIIAFPAIAGFIIGYAVKLVAGQSLGGGARVLAALVGGLVALLVYWGGSYVYYQSTFVDFVRADIEGVTYDESFNADSFLTTLKATVGMPVDENEEYSTEELITALRETEEEAYGTTGVPAMFTLYAENGISISRSGSSANGLNLTGVLAYGLWVIEALILLGVAIGTSLRDEEETEEETPALHTAV